MVADLAAVAVAGRHAGDRMVDTVDLEPCDLPCRGREAHDRS